jgi:transposase-like protein
MSILNNGYFRDEAAAIAKLESVLWPHGPVCLHCGNTQKVYDLSKTRLGLKKCGACRRQFTVRAGTIFQSSHIPLHKWLQATYLLCCSKKRISARQLQHILEVSYKTAWLMSHRIKEAMHSRAPAATGDGGQVERDQTVPGGKRGRKPGRQKDRRRSD